MRWNILATVCIGLACASGSWGDTVATRNIVFIPKSSDHQYWERMHEGAIRAINELGNVTLTWRGPAHSGDVDAQIRILETYAHKGIDAIVLAPIDRSRLKIPVKAATEMGVRVVIVDSELDGERQSSFIGTDNFAAGALAAAQMGKLLNGKGQLAVVRTYKGSVSVESRATGFLQHLKAHTPKIQVVADIYTGDAAGNIYTAIKTMLLRVQNIDAVFAPNETTAQATLRVLRDLGLAGKVRFIGFDATSLLLEAIRQHEVDGLVLQDPRQIGYLGVKAAIEPLNPTAQGAFTVTHIPVVIVTSENIDQPAVQDLLSREKPQ